MATVHQECNTEEQRSIVRFLWARGINANYIHKEVGSVCCAKPFTTGSRNPLKDARKSQMMNQRRGIVKGLLRFGFRRIGKRRDKRINIDGGYAEK
jgi:hypothetical protein